MAKTVKTTEATTSARLIYIGPTLHRRVLIANSIFKGDLPSYVTRLIEKLPALVSMIVLVEDLVANKKAAAEQGTELNRVYRELESVRFNENGEVRI